MAEIDACNGYGFVAQAVYALEQSAVAATAYHHRVGRLLACSRAIYFRGLHLDAEHLLDLLGKLLIYRVIETVTLKK